MSGDETTLAVIQEQGRQVKEGVAALAGSVNQMLVTLANHDKRIDLLAQLQEERRMYQEKWNTTVERRLDDQAPLWANNQAEHDAMMRELHQMGGELREARGGGKVALWSLNLAVLVGVALMSAAMTYLLGLAR